MELLGLTRTGSTPHRRRRRLRAGHPLVGPLNDLEGEATLAARGDHQPAARVGGIGLRMARRTERHQAVGIEVRAALGAFDDVVDLEGAPVAAGLAAPAGAPGEVMRVSLLDALASAGWTGGAPPYEGRRPSGR